MNKNTVEIKSISAEKFIKLDHSNIHIIDLREKELVSLHPFTKALNFPFSNIWSDIDNIPKDRPIYIFCHSGEISREITKILTDRGYDATDIEGGYQAISKMLLQNPVHIDLKGKKCPGVIIQTAEAIDAIFDGQHLIVEATEEAFVSDIAIWCEKTGNKLISIYTDSKIIHAEIEKKSFSKEQKLEMFKEKNDKTFIVFSSDLDKVISAFILANGAIAMGRKVSMFFTFWGLSILRKTKKVSVEKSFIEKLFSFMLPRGTKGLKLSKMNMGGFGAKMIRRVMEEKGVDSLEELVQNAISHGARIVACQTTMYMMGIHKEELIDGIELGGVSSFLGAAENSDTNLFI